MTKKLMMFSASTVLLLAIATFAFGQSGSRGGGGGGVIGGGGGSIGGSSGGIGGGINLNRRPSSREREKLRQQQIAQAREAARANAIRQQEALEAQRKKLLKDLGLQPDGALNRKLRRLAFAEAKIEYKAIRKMKAPLATAGSFLKQPFRLPGGLVDLTKSETEIQWPKSLDDAAHAESKKAVQQLLQSDEATTEQFRIALTSLGTQLGQRVIDGEIKSNDYARGKRFLTGLAHEINAHRGLEM